MQRAHVTDRLEQIKKKNNNQKKRRKQKQKSEIKTDQKRGGATDTKQNHATPCPAHPEQAQVTNRVGEFPTSKILDQSDSCIFAQDGGAHLRLQNVRIGTSNGKQSLKNYYLLSHS